MRGHKTGTAMATPMTAPTSTDIRLDLISMTEWRVCDRRFGEADSRAVLGFIERHDSDYEVTRVSAPDRIQVFAGLASATASFSTLD